MVRKKDAQSMKKCERTKTCWVHWNQWENESKQMQSLIYDDNKLHKWGIPLITSISLFAVLI